MSVLLTDEAVRAAAVARFVADYWRPPTEDDLPPGLLGDRAALEGGLRFLATEGREALVERVAGVLATGRFGARYTVTYAERETAEAVVTALFGEPG